MGPVYATRRPEGKLLIVRTNSILRTNRRALHDWTVSLRGFGEGQHAKWPLILLNAHGHHFVRTEADAKPVAFHVQRLNVVFHTVANCC